MKVICSVCKYGFDNEKTQKCPRCGAIFQVRRGCENCSGCAVWKSCKFK